MSKHTPGPWAVNLSDNGIHALHDSEGKHFANLRNVCGASALVRDADAMLIAAAPDLLAALRDFVDLIEDPNMPMAELIRRGKAALAKVED